MLEQLGAEIPRLPPYDPAEDERFPWEDNVIAAIEKLLAEQEAERNESRAGESPESGSPHERRSE